MLDNSPHFRMIELDETISTNTFLQGYNPPTPTDITLVTAEYQTAGRGQRGNSWESERSQNLLFSVLLHPTFLMATQAFALSEIVALSIRDALSRFLSEEVTVKWPNDVYVGDRKIAGILIENDLCGHRLQRAILGCGINVNQESFSFPLVSAVQTKDSHAVIPPVPVSLRQLLGHDTERRFVLDAFMEAFMRRYDSRTDLSAVHQEYLSALYRRSGLYPFQDAAGRFIARIADVEPSGFLVLEDEQGHLRRYAFKEVSCVLN